jgi:hypothetical protein
LPFRKSSRPPEDRISSQQLADFGRYEFLKEQSGIDASKAFSLAEPLASLSWNGDPGARPIIVAELRRHAARGEWEKVGAWKFVREFLDEAPDTQDLIDGGLLAIAAMRVTNLGVNLAMIDGPRYAELTGGPVPNDGFFGPPVFDSDYGSNRQYYLDSAVAAAARRTITRLPCAPGIAPGPVTDAARSMWDFGQLLYRGPLLVNPDIAFEPNVVLPAVAAASGVDHAVFMDQVADAVLDPGSYISSGYAPIGSARFAEDYLDHEVLRSEGYRRLLDSGLAWFLKTGEPGLMVAPDLLTLVQQERLTELGAGR